MSTPSDEGGAPDNLSEGELEDGEVLSSEEEDGSEKTPVACESTAILNVPELTEQQQSPNVESAHSENEDKDSTAIPQPHPSPTETDTQQEVERTSKDSISRDDEDLEDGEIFSDDEEAAYFPQLVKSRQISSTSAATTATMATSKTSGSSGGGGGGGGAAEGAPNNQRTPPRRKSRFDKDWKRSPNTSDRITEYYSSTATSKTAADSESDSELFFEDRVGKNDANLDFEKRKKDHQFSSSSPSTAYKYGRRDYSNREGKDKDDSKGGYGSKRNQPYSRRQSRFDQTAPRSGFSGSSYTQFASPTGMTSQQFHSLSSKVVKRREKGLSLLPLPQQPQCHSLDQCNYPAPPSWYLESVEQWENKEKEREGAEKNAGGGGGGGDDSQDRDLDDGRTEGEGLMVGSGEISNTVNENAAAASHLDTMHDVQSIHFEIPPVVPANPTAVAPAPPPSLMALSLPPPPPSILTQPPTTTTPPSVPSSELKLKVVCEGSDDGNDVNMGDFSTEPVSNLKIICETDEASTGVSVDKTELSVSKDDTCQLSTKPLEMETQDHTSQTPPTALTTTVSSGDPSLSPTKTLSPSSQSTDLFIDQEHQTPPQPMEVEPSSDAAVATANIKAPSTSPAVPVPIQSAAILNPFPRVLPSESDELPMEDFDYDDYLDQLDEEEDEPQGKPPSGGIRGNNAAKQPAQTLKSLLSESLVSAEPLAGKPTNQKLGGLLAGNDDPLSEAFQCIGKEGKPEVGGASQLSLRALVDSDDDESIAKKRGGKKGGRVTRSARRRQKDAAWRAKQRELEVTAVARKAEEERLKALVPCKYYLNGQCKHGDSCQYSHDVPQAKKKGLCKFYLHDSCTKGESCLYHHGTFPCKFYHSTGSFCKQGSQCKFSHAPLTAETRELLLSVLDSGSEVGSLTPTEPSPKTADTLVISIPKSIAKTNENEAKLVVSIPHSSLTKPKFGSSTKLEVVNIESTVPVPVQHGMGPPPHQTQFNPYSVPPTMPPHPPPPNFQAPPVPLFPPGPAPPPAAGPPPPSHGAMGEISQMPPPPHPPPHPPHHQPPAPLAGRRCLLPTPPPNMILTPDDRKRLESTNPEYWESPSIQHKDAGPPGKGFGAPHSHPPPPAFNQPRVDASFQQQQQPNHRHPPPPSLPPPPPLPPSSFNQNRPPFSAQIPQVRGGPPLPPTGGQQQQQQQQQQISVPSFPPPPHPQGGSGPVPIPPWDRNVPPPAGGMDPRQGHSTVHPPSVPLPPNWGPHSVPPPQQQPQQHDKRFGMGSPPQPFHSNVSTSPGNLYHGQQSPPPPSLSNLEPPRGDPNFGVPPQFGGGNIHPQTQMQNNSYPGAPGMPPAANIGPWGAANTGEDRNLSPERQNVMPQSYNQPHPVDPSSSSNSPRRVDPRMKYSHLKIKSKASLQSHFQQGKHQARNLQPNQTAAASSATSHSILKKKDGDKTKDETKVLDFYHSAREAGDRKMSNFKIPKLLQDPRSLDKPLDAQDLFGREREAEGEMGGAFGRVGGYGEIDTSGGSATTTFGSGYTTFYSRNEPQNINQSSEINASKSIVLPSSSGGDHTPSASDLQSSSYGEISLQGSVPLDNQKQEDFKPRVNPDNPLLKLLEDEEDSTQDHASGKMAAAEAPALPSKAQIPSYLAAIGDLGSESDLRIDSAFGALDAPVGGSAEGGGLASEVKGHKEGSDGLTNKMPGLFGFGL